MVGTVLVALLLLGAVEGDDDDTTAVGVGVLAEDLGGKEGVASGEQADIAPLEQVREQGIPEARHLIAVDQPVGQRRGVAVDRAQVAQRRARNRARQQGEKNAAMLCAHLEQPRIAFAILARDLVEIPGVIEVVAGCLQ
ncbi:hypothetical protein D3C86_1729330 [compost metagenome]